MQLSSNLQPPTSNLQPPTSNLQPPTSNLQPPTSNFQRPTSNLRPATGRLVDFTAALGQPLSCLKLSGLIGSFLQFILFVLFLGSPLDSMEQVMGAPASTYVNEQLRFFFANIAPPTPQPPVFYDMAVHFTSKDWYRPINLDTSTTVNFVTIYDELYTAHYDTTQFLRVDTMLRQSVQYGADTILMLMVDYRYCTLIDGDFSDVDTTYFHLDTSTFQLIDNPNAPGSPYRLESVFTIGALPAQSTSGSLTFALNPDFVFLEGDKEALYDAGSLRLEINFSDGTGWHTVPTTYTSYFNVNYSNFGDHIIAMRTVDTRDGDRMINFSQTKFWSPAAENYEEPDEIWTNIPGMNVEFYEGCDAQSGTYEPKYIIWVPGFDFIEGKENGKRYTEYFDKSGLGDLRNYGYNILIVDWKNSKLPVQDNAANLVELFDFLKCSVLDPNSDPQHQFVLIGSSLGAIVSRYALTWMEQNPNFSSCFPNLHHNTRLWISLDGEYHGAYYPLAIQQFYDAPLSVFGMSADFYHHLYQQANGLNSGAAKQLLSFHISTEAGDEYGPHADRVDLLDDFEGLNNNGGYPEHCKMIAIGNGLFTGEHQTGTNDECVMEPGHLFLGYNHEMSMSALGVVLLGGQTVLNLRGIENNENFFESSSNIFYWKPEFNIQMVERCLPWPFNNVCTDWPVFTFGWVMDTTVAYNLSKASDGVPTMEIMPGSIINGEEISSWKQQEFIVAAPDWLGLNLSLSNAINQQSVGDNCDVFSYADVRFAALGFNYQSSLQSQGLNSCYVPNFSAIDYQGDDDLDLDLTSENVATLMSNTPFDIIIGEVNGLADYPNQNQTDALFVPSSHRSAEFKYPSLNRPHPRLINHLLPDTFMTFDTTGTWFARYLNREIGDEELLLENLLLDRQAIFQATDRISAGANLNPLYTYPSQAASGIFRSYTDNGWPFNTNLYGYDLNINGIFSRDEPFEIEANAVAILEAENTITTTGTINNGTLTEVFLPQAFCDNFYADTSFTGNKKGPDIPTSDIDQQLYSVYPNPVATGSSCYVDGFKAGNYRLIFSDVSGKSYSTNLVLNDSSNTVIVRINQDMVPGLYMLRIEANTLIFTHKIIVQ